MKNIKFHFTNYYGDMGTWQFIALPSVILYRDMFMENSGLAIGWLFWEVQIRFVK